MKVTAVQIFIYDVQHIRPPIPILLGICLPMYLPVLHGTYGEDGTVQGLLELANVPYVGAGVLGSALGMDKVLMKTVLAQHSVPQARFWSCLRRDWENDSSPVIETVEKDLGYPCFVKPANLGSSVGISKVYHREELINAMDLAAIINKSYIISKNNELSMEYIWGLASANSATGKKPGQSLDTGFNFDGGGIGKI